MDQCLYRHVFLLPLQHKLDYYIKMLGRGQQILCFENLNEFPTFIVTDDIVNI